MTKPRSKLFRIARAVGVTLVVLMALYVIAGNVLLKTRLLREATNMTPEMLVLEYDSAYTIIPGHANVKGLKLRFEDGNIRFALKMEEANVRIRLVDLLKQKFHATRVRGTGISWRMLHKVAKIEGNEARIAAFPPIEGFNTPMTLAPPPPGPPSTGEGNWTVHLEDVDVEVAEVWMLEYRYVGVGRASGSFEIKPMKSVWVGPAHLELKEGTLSAGENVLSQNFGMQAECTIAPFDVPTTPGLKVLSSITVSTQIAALLDDAGAFLELYNPGLEATGTGTLTADVRLTKGLLTTGSVLNAHLAEMRLRSDGAGFNGTVNMDFKLAPDAKGLEVPVGHAAVAGTVLVPISKEAAVTAALSGVSADLSLTSPDMAEGFELQWLHAKLGEARVEDASAITELASKTAPIIAPAVLGKGPLTASGTADVTKGKTVVRLKEAKLGDAELKGAAVKRGEAWNGAAFGRVAVVPIGVRMKNGAVEVLPFSKDAWLTEQLERLGIEAEISLR
jgi:hypothetical protein